MENQHKIERHGRERKRRILGIMGFWGFVFVIWDFNGDDMV